MSIKAGEQVYINHYSRKQPSSSYILDAAGNSVKIKLTKDFTVLDLFEGDPVIIGYEYEGEAFICECIITEIDTKDNTVTLEIKEDNSLSDKRLSENYPVSIYSDIKMKDSKKRNAAIVKNINLTGMSVYSRHDMENGDEIEIDVYLDKRVVSLKSVILWKSQVSGYIEYGLKIIYSDFNDKNLMKLYLQMLKEDQYKAIGNIKNS